jgi:hypothetical protein
MAVPNKRVLTEETREALISFDGPSSSSGLVDLRHDQKRFLLTLVVILV